MSRRTRQTAGTTRKHRQKRHAFWENPVKRKRNKSRQRRCTGCHRRQHMTTLIQVDECRTFVARTTVAVVTSHRHVVAITRRRHVLAIVRDASQKRASSLATSRLRTCIGRGGATFCRTTGVVVSCEVADAVTMYVNKQSHTRIQLRVMLVQRIVRARRHGFCFRRLLDTLSRTSSNGQQGFPGPQIWSP